MPAHPLSLREREEIRYGIARSESLTSIAGRLGRHRTTISREIARNGGRDTYRAYAAQDRAKTCRARPKVRLLQQHPELAAHVRSRLEAKDSPMTIAVELVQGIYPMVGRTVSHETIYRAVYDPFHRVLPRNLYRCLHRRRRHRYPRGYRNPRRDTWRNGLPLISERPAAAADRSEVGHLEGDLIVGSNRRAAIITVFDRKSRYLWMAALPNGVSAPKTLEVFDPADQSHPAAAASNADLGPRWRARPIRDPRPTLRHQRVLRQSTLTLAAPHQRERQRLGPPLRRQEHRPRHVHRGRPASHREPHQHHAPTHPQLGHRPTHLRSSRRDDRLNSP
jgi:IS30 family transposase